MNVVNIWIFFSLAFRPMRKCSVMSKLNAAFSDVLLESIELNHLLMKIAHFALSNFLQFPFSIPMSIYSVLKCDFIV